MTYCKLYLNLILTDVFKNWFLDFSDFSAVHYYLSMQGFLFNLSSVCLHNI